MTGVEDDTRCLLEVRDLRVVYKSDKGRPVTAVDGVSLRVNRAEIVGIVGESGSGKTTLGLCMAGFIKPTLGSIEVHPTRERGDMRDVSPVQMIFQEAATALNPRMPTWRSVAEALSHGRSVGRGLYGSAVQQLERVGLTHEVGDKRPSELSGGQRQRAAIARALASGAELIVCDEAVSALDASLRARVLNLMSRLRDELGISFVFISHDIAVVSHLSDRLAVMHAGRLVEEGPTADVVDWPQMAYTQTLIAAVPQLQRT